MRNRFFKLFVKLRTKVWNRTVRVLRKASCHQFIHRAYWHAIFEGHKAKGESLSYLSATPNANAGIGHQMANWISGYWFSQKFGLKFAHIPFSDQTWDRFLGFSEGEKTVKELVEIEHYKRVNLPLFDEDNQKEIKIVEKIIDSYRGENVVFVVAQDQFYREQIGVMDVIKRKFHNSQERNNSSLIYSEAFINIAVHVRRGDIASGKKAKNKSMLVRWLDNNYYVHVLENVLAKWKFNKSVRIYLFSQGSVSDFSEFKKIKNIEFCLDMNAKQSFLHLVFADLLITSKSSFSYKPALLSNGIKVCPKDFWHSYPNSKDWFLTDNSGNFLDKE